MAAVLSVALSSAAPAHEGHQGERVVVEGISPELDGIEVRAVPGTFGKVELSVTGPQAAVVLGASGQPILRVGPRGVEANAAAPEWYEDNEPLGIAQAPSSARRGAPARWKRVSVRRSWEWFDHRLHPAGSGRQQWSIPIVLGTVKGKARGRIEPANGTLSLRLDREQPRTGLTVTAIDAPTSAVRLRNEGATRVRVLGPDGEVFARIGPRGAEVNVRSSVWLATAQFRRRDLLETVIDPEAKPQFVLISSEPELIWPDPRLLADRPLPTVRAGEQTPVRVATWSIPVVLEGGGGRVAIEGSTVLGPSAAEPGRTGVAADAAVAAADDDAPDDSWVLIVIGLVAAVALFSGAALVLRSRR